MSYHELEAEVMRVRGLLAAALEENTRISKERDDAWSKHNWKQRECDGLREKIAAMEAPEKPSADLDSLLAQAGIKFDGHVDEWMLRDCNVETRGNTWPEGRMWGQPIQLRLQLDNGKMRVDLGLFGIQHAGNEAKDYPFLGVIIVRPTEPLAPKGAGE